jgi:uncharacterized coiled-coil DUF342 family protein
MKENGEFKGTVKTEIKNIYNEIKEIKDNLTSLNTKFDQLSIDVNSLKTKAQIWGGIAGAIISAVIALVIKFL